MQPGPESEHLVPCSGRIVLECECGERIVLLGLEEDWRLEERTTFECECGEELTFNDRLDEEVLRAESLISNPSNFYTSRN